jgi:type IV pilus assembly protein PilC
MVANVALVFLGLIAFFIGGLLFVRSERGSQVVLWIALHAPVVGELVRETYAARFARTLSSLLSSSVPVLDALAITKEVVHAKVFADVIDEAEANVRKGEPLSQSFINHGNLYPVLMSDMLAVGEETGKVAEMLQQIAEFYEEDVQEKTKDLSTIIEPLLMLLIGTFVGIFAISMIAPIYQLSSAIG